MLNKEDRKFIESNIDKLSLEALSRKLGISVKRLKNELKELNVKPKARITDAPGPEYKTASIGPRNRKKVIVIAIFILAATFAAYFNSLKNDFIWDDEFLILNNSQIKNFSHFSNIFKTYIGFGSENINNFYRPIQELSNMVDYALWGKDAFGFHLTNILLHSCAAILVFILVYYLCDTLVIAALSGIFFGVHPIHTEAVTYIAGRADPLYAVFFLLALIFFVRYANHIIKNGKKTAFLALSSIFFVLAILSKEISIILPLMILLYIYLLLKGVVPSVKFEKIKFAWIPSVAIVCLYVFVRLQYLNFSKIAPPTLLLQIPFLNRLLTFFKVILVYIGLLIAPAGLHMERTIAVARTFFEPSAFVSFFAVLCILASGFFLYKKSRLASFFIFWFFVALLPVSNIVPINSFIAEHWLYMPSVAYFFAVSGLIYWIYDKTRGNIIIKTVLIIIAGTAVVTYAFMTASRNRDWKDEIAFFENTIKYSPRNARLYLNFGNTYYEKGNFDKALEQYKKAVSIQKNYETAYSNIGSIYVTRGDLQEAESYFKKAIGIKFNFPIAHYQLGAVYYSSGRPKEAIDELEISLAQLPQQYQTLNLLGQIYLEQGDRQKSANALRRSLEIMPGQRNIEEDLRRIGQ